MSRSAYAFAAVLMVVLLAGCSMPTVSDGGAKGTGGEISTAKVLGDPKTSGLKDWPGTFRAPVSSYDFDGDGVQELFGQSDDTKVYVFSATTGRALAVLPTRTPPAWHVNEILNGVEAAQLSPGASPSLVVTSHAAYVTRWDFDAAASTEKAFVFTKAWEKRMNACYEQPGMDAKPTLADFDGEPGLEIAVQTEEMGFFVLRSDGSTLWKQCWGGGNGAPVAADLDGDGRNEVLVGSDAGFVAALDGKTGNPYWTFDARKHGITPASIIVSPTAADLDGQMPLEVLFTARHAPGGEASDFPDYHMAIFALRQNPATYQVELLWMRQPDWANPMSATALVVDDVDGDGRGDIFGLDWNTIGHRPGDWERLGDAHAFRLDADGNDVWVRSLDTWWSNSAVALADMDGDGSLDLLVNAPRDGHDGVWSLDTKTGKSLDFAGAAGWKFMRMPLLLDLKHNGSMHLAYPAQPADGSARGAILLFDLGVPYEVADDVRVKA